MTKTVAQAMEYEQVRIHPLKRIKRSELDRKLFRGMSDRTILLGGLHELYTRHTVGFWQTSCLLSWSAILITVLT